MSNAITRSTSPDVSTAVQPAGPVQVGDCLLDMAQARVTRGGQPLALNGRALQVLALLAAHPGRLLGKDEVLDAVWGHRHVTESVLKGAVNVLRLALGDDAKAPRYVETVPRRGYRLLAPVVPAETVMLAGAATAAAAPVPVEDTALAPAPALQAWPATEALIGREAALQQLLGLMAEQRLVTVTGLGGIGKTRLALAAAAAAPPLPDGLWLLRLEDLDDPALVVPAVANLLRLGQGAAASVAALVRTLSGMRLRLLLDNAEHLVAAVAELAAAVLQGAPGVQLLVTSQLPLRVGGERLLALTPLALPTDVGDSAPAPEGYAAARLLCARIAQQRPGWQASAAEHGHIAAICRALDGVPLALELAAARVPLLGLAGVRARLDERFALLTRGARDAAARHRTLAAALDWTFSLLTSNEREAMQRLAVFVGSFGVDAAESVLEGLWAQAPLDVIDELHARSLLVIVQDASQAAPRLRMYDSVRRHALAGLAPAGREADARERHLRWMCQRFDDAHDRDLLEPQLPLLKALQEDVESLRVALRHGLEAQNPELLALGVQLAGRSALYWGRSGRRTEGQQWLTRAQAALQAQPQLLSPLEQGRFHYGQAAFVCRAYQGDFRVALARLRAALPLLQAAGDVCRVYASQSYLQALQGRAEPPGNARALAEAAQAALQPQWPPLARSPMLNLQGLACRDAGDMAGFLFYAEQNSALARHCGAHHEHWMAENAVGQALALLGRVDEACACYARLVDDIRAQGWLRGHMQIVAMGAALALRHGLDADSRRRALDALHLLAGEGMVWWMADALPWAAWHEGRADDARRLQHWADELARRRGDTRGPIFGGMREALLARLGGTEAAAATPADGALPLTEAAALDLALGLGTSALLPTLAA